MALSIVVIPYVLARAVSEIGNDQSRIMKENNKLLKDLLGHLKGTELEIEQTDSEDVKEESHPKLDGLKGKLTVDEMIVRMKDTQELRIITKVQYEADKELHLTNKYTVIDEN